MHCKCLVWNKAHCTETPSSSSHCDCGCTSEWRCECHRLSTRLNCLTGLSCGIIFSVVILPVMCIVRTSVLLSLVFPHSYRLTLGQRLSPMYSSSYRCLVSALAALDGPCLLCLPLCLLIAYCVLTDCLLITVLLPPLVMDLICMTCVLYWPLCGLSYK